MTITGVHARIPGRAGVTVAALAANLPGGREIGLGVWGWLLAPVQGVLLLCRRRIPALVAVASARRWSSTTRWATRRSGLRYRWPGRSSRPANGGRMRWAAGTTCVLLVIGYGYRIRAGQDLGYLFGYDLIVNLVILIGAIAAGDAVRSVAWPASSNSNAPRRRPPRGNENPAS